jgi:hypothetical protein
LSFEAFYTSIWWLAISRLLKPAFQILLVSGCKCCTGFNYQV